MVFKRCKAENSTKTMPTGEKMPRMATATKRTS
jgi:hypothetical protein